MGERTTTRLSPVNIGRMTSAKVATDAARMRAVEALMTILSHLEENPVGEQVHWGHAGSEASMANELVSIANRLNGHTEG